MASAGPGASSTLIGVRSGSERGFWTEFPARFGSPPPPPSVDGRDVKRAGWKNRSTVTPRRKIEPVDRWTTRNWRRRRRRRDAVFGAHDRLWEPRTNIARI
ncbi:NADH dehydrogenase subunit E [Anopheles sinensis]|uniref:NADH dehydrogenase subunit E n=1 Tax=Anopheles sinensis TaxID=74873 RepID=A0A084VPK7_ANOSI|nr:NADH dehydrogenase subunit E [Anopheles sinensis]